MRFLSKISVIKIIDSHLDTLVNHKTKKHDFDDWLTFIIIPFLVGFSLVYFKIYLENNELTVIITALSILVGLLFNVVVLLFDIVHKDAQRSLKNDLLKQLISNITFSVLTSIVTIVFCLVTFSDNYTLKAIASFFVYVLATNFLLTVLMILKRTYAMFQQEMKDAQDAHDALERAAKEKQPVEPEEN